MYGPYPIRWMDRIIGWCCGILLASIALYCAVRILQAIWCSLVVIVGIVVSIAVIIRIVVYFTSRNRW
jgi:hypothetical protein